MLIGIDLDSTLNTLGTAWAKWIAAVTGKPFTTANMTQWDIKKVSGLGNRVYDFFHIEEMFEKLECQPWSQPVTEKLSEGHKHELFVVSSCLGGDYVQKQKWLARHFPWIKKRNFIACSHKGLLNLDVLIDDGEHNFKGFKGKRLLFDQPWNQITTEPDLIRVNGWHFVPQQLGI